MPKIKTKKSATKKFKMSATGKAMRTQAGKRHLNGYKARGRKRNLRGTTAVYNDGFSRAVKTAETLPPGRCGLEEKTKESRLWK